MAWGLWELRPRRQLAASISSGLCASLSCNEPSCTTSKCSPETDEHRMGKALMALHYMRCSPERQTCVMHADVCGMSRGSSASEPAHITLR